MHPDLKALLDESPNGITNYFAKKEEEDVADLETTWDMEGGSEMWNQVYE